METLGVLTVATNKYTEYWKEMVLSVHENLFPAHKITFHVFTDKVEVIREFSSRNPYLDIQIYKIESLGWPNATLLRYEIYQNHATNYSEDILMHLDADMLAISSAETILSEGNWSSGMFFVSHPGYWRDKSNWRRARFYFSAPKIGIRDIIRLIWIGGIGAWEIDPRSEAFVIRQERKVYACGGIWIGRKAPFLDFVASMADNVQKDLIKGIVAKWHDESHLNWWVARNKSVLNSPSLCHDASFKNLRNIEGIITAVRK